MATNRVSTASDGTQANGSSNLVNSYYYGGYNYGNAQQQAQVFSPDGKEIVFYSSAPNLTNNNSSGVILTSTQTGREIKAEYVTSSSYVNETQFTRDGTSVLFQTQNGISEENLATGNIQAITPSANQTGVHFLASSDTGSKIAYSAYVNTSGSNYSYTHTYVKDFTSGNSVEVGSGSGNEFRIQFNENLTKAIYTEEGSRTGAPQIYAEDLTTGAKTIVSGTQSGTLGNSAAVGGILSRDGSEAVFSTRSTNLSSAAPNGGVFVKNLSTQALSVVAADTTSSYFHETSLSADGNEIALQKETSTSTGATTSSNTSQLQIADLSHGTTKTVPTSLTETFDSSNGNVSGQAFGQTVLSSDGTKIAYVVSTYQGQLGPSAVVSTQAFVYDTSTGTTTAVSGSQSGYVNSLVFSPDGTKIATTLQPSNENSTTSTTTTVYDLTSGQSTTVPATAVFFSPDSQTFAYSSSNANQVPNDTNNASDVFLASVCFASGTRIRTARGDVAVEALQVGDLAVTASGAERPIRWIGHRTFDCRRAADPAGVLPIRVAAHAFGDGLPSTDLFLSPGHSVRVGVFDPMLMPIGRLINGATIARHAVDHVTYWHVELDSHDVLLANDLPAESFLDCGNRFGLIEQAGSYDRAAAPHTPADFCLPFIDEGEALDAVRTLLAARAKNLGWAATADLDMHLMVDGVRVDPDVDGEVARFAFPAGARSVVLASATYVPSELAPVRDHRRLGVSLYGLEIDDGLSHRRMIGADDALLAGRVHGDEGGAHHRFTDGRLDLPREMWAGCRSLVLLRVHHDPASGRRWLAPATAAENVVALRSGG